MKNKLFKHGLSALSILLIGFILIGSCKKKKSEDPVPPPPPPPEIEALYSLDVKAFDNMTSAMIAYAEVKVIDAQGKTYKLDKNDDNIYQFKTDNPGTYTVKVGGQGLIEAVDQVELKNDACPSCGLMMVKDMYVTAKTPMVEVGTEGGAVPDQHGMLNLMIPPGMLDEPVKISVTDFMSEEVDLKDNLKNRAYYFVKQMMIDFDRTLTEINELTLSYVLTDLEVALDDYNNMKMIVDGQTYNGVYNAEGQTVDFTINTPSSFNQIIADIEKPELNGYRFYQRCVLYLKDNGVVGKACQVSYTETPFDFSCPAVENPCRAMSFTGVAVVIDGVPEGNYTGRAAAYLPVHEIATKSLTSARAVVDGTTNMNVGNVIMSFEATHSGGGGN